MVYGYWGQLAWMTGFIIATFSKIGYTGAMVSRRKNSVVDMSGLKCLYRSRWMGLVDNVSNLRQMKGLVGMQLHEGFFLSPSCGAKFVPLPLSCTG